MKLCYIEDFMGGFICYENQKKYFLSVDESATVCFEGTKEELEDHLGYKISEDKISHIK